MQYKSLHKKEIESLYQQIVKKHTDPNETIQIIESNANRKIMTIPYGKDIYPNRDLIRQSINSRKKIGIVMNPKKVFPSLIFKSKYKLYYLFEHLPGPISGGSVVFATLPDFDPKSFPKGIYFEDTNRLYSIPTIRNPMSTILGYRYASFWEAVLFYNSVKPTWHNSEILLPAIKSQVENDISGSYFSDPQSLRIQLFSQKIPTIWQPHIIEENRQVRLIYHTFSAFGNVEITRHTCTFFPKSLYFRQESEIIATGSGGYTI